MPRLPKHKTPLRLFREALGKSQKEFSDFLEKKIRIPATTYKSWESGARTVDEGFATQLMILYGVDPQSIMSKKGKPKDLLGRRYSTASKGFVLDRERQYSEDSLVFLLTLLSDRYLAVLLAALHKGRLTEAAYIFERAIGEAVTKLGLSASLKVTLGSKEEFQAWKGIDVGMLGAPHRFPHRPLVNWGKESESSLRQLIKSTKGVARGAP